MSSTDRNLTSSDSLVLFTVSLVGEWAAQGSIWGLTIIPTDCKFRPELPGLEASLYGKEIYCFPHLK